MKIAKVKITNFKCYEETFSLALNEALNVIVGANESGKTTILEAIHLALRGPDSVWQPKLMPACWRRSTRRCWSSSAFAMMRRYSARRR